MGGDGQGGRAAAPGDLLDGDRRADRIHAGAIVLLRDVQAEQPQRPHPADGRPVEFICDIHFMGFGLYFFRDEIVNGFFPDLLLFR